MAKHERNLKYILPVVIFFVIALISWSWLLLFNPDFSDRAAPFINKYFSGLIDIFSGTGGNNTDEPDFLPASDTVNGKFPEADEETAEENNAAETQAESTEPDDSADNKLPVIQLKIYEGPKYDTASQTCYYRIRAVVAGEPKPVVQFGRDDSKGALGPYETQINLKSNEKSYVLSATAANTNGTVMDTITLNWGCNSNPVISEVKLSTDIIFVNGQYEISVTAVDPDGDTLSYNWTVSGGSIENGTSGTAKWNTPSNPENYDLKVEVTDSKGAKTSKTISVYVGSQTAPETTAASTEEEDDEDETTSPATTSPPATTEPGIQTVTVPKKTKEGGYLEYGGQTHAGGNAYAGDSSNNKPCAGFVSFDITSLDSLEVVTATLKFSSAASYGNPLEYADAFWINIVSLGSEPIIQDDFNLTGIAIQSFASSSVTCNADKLKSELQKAIESGKSRFQIRVHFSGPYSDNDSSRDGWEYLQSNISLVLQVQ